MQLSPIIFFGSFMRRFFSMHFLFFFSVLMFFSFPTRGSEEDHGASSGLVEKIQADGSAERSYCEMRNEGSRSSFCCFKGSFGKCLPSFIIAGAQKSGTTALAAELASHPHVSFAKRKELHFFDRRKEYRKGLTHYLDSFKFRPIGNRSDVLPHFAEATPFYIASRDACQRISETVPEAKLVILLREPVSRAYSEYQMKKRRVESQNEWISLAILHSPQLYSCMLLSPFNWSKIESCVPPVLSQHEHWQKLVSSVSRVVSRKQLPDVLKSSGNEDGDDDVDKVLRPWAEMMMTCFAKSPEKLFGYPQASLSFSKAKHANTTSSFIKNTLSSGIRTLELGDLEFSSFEIDPLSQITDNMLGAEIAGNFSFSSASKPSRRSLSGKTGGSHLVFQPLSCLGRHANESISPLYDAFYEEMNTFQKCSGGTFLSGTVEEMDASLESCIKVQAGISRQYVYRSLYALQLYHCLKYIPRENLLILPSEAFKSSHSSAALEKLMSFLNLPSLSQVPQWQNDIKSLQEKVDKNFPGFEGNSGWKLQSSYSSIPQSLRRHLSDFFREQNDKLFHLIKENFSEYWVE